MEITLRRATDADADAVADLYLRARRAAADDIPSTVHSDDDVRRWIAARVIPHTEAWIAEDAAGSLAGLLVLDGDWVDQLYVEPTRTGQGIGTQLLECAKRERSDGDNEEGAPDVLYVWPA